MALIIEADGSMACTEPKNGSDFSLEELQFFVGGLIEILDIDENKVLVCNEEGRLKNLPINERVSGFLDLDFPIFGPVLVCMKSQIL